MERFFEGRGRGLAPVAAYVRETSEGYLDSIKDAVGVYSWLLFSVAAVPDHDCLGVCCAFNYWVSLGQAEIACCLGGVCKRADLVAVPDGQVPVRRERDIVLMWLLRSGGCVSCDGTSLDPLPVDRV